MKPKTTVILLVLAVLIGGFVWYDTTHWQDTEKRQEQEKRVFPNLKSTDITLLELHNTHGVIRVAKTNDVWNMSQPFAVRANKSMVDSILSDLEFLDAERTMTAQDLKDANATLAGYGLETPRVEATFIDGGKTNTIRLGDESKVGDNVYAAIGGSDRVYVIPKRLVESLNKTVDDMRDRTVVDVIASQLNKIELRAGNRQIEVTKLENTPDGSDGWRITRPINARADKTKIDDLGGKLADLKVEKFVTEDPKDLKLYGLDEPGQEVTLFTRGADSGKIVQFGSVLTNDAGQVYAKRKATSSIFTVKKDILTNLVVQVNDLRDHHLAEFDADQVKAIDIRTGGQAIQLAHGSNDWTITEPVKLKADPTVCEDLVRTIHDAQIKDFAADVITDPAQFGLDKPVCEITLKKEKTVVAATTNEPPKTTTSTNAAPAAATPVEMIPLVTLQVGKTDPAKGLVYVKRSDEAFVYGLATNFSAGLPRGVLDLRDRTILEIDPSSIQKLELTRGETHFITEQVILASTNRVESREWNLVSPKEGSLDVTAVEELVSSLAHLHAEKLVAENAANLAQYGLDQPSITVHFGSTANAAAQRTLLVGKESPDKRRYAMLAGNPLVFELDPAIDETLSKEFVAKPEPKPAAATTPQVPVAPANPPATATQPPIAK